MSIRKWIQSILFPFSMVKQDIITEHELISNSPNFKIKIQFLPTIKREISSAYSDIYLSPLTNEASQTGLGNKKRLESYFSQSRVQMAAFFGLPIHPDISGENKLTWGILFRNFFGLRPKSAPRWQRILSYVLSLFFFFKNTFLFLSKTLWNIVTLFTEFIPRVLEILCEVGLKKIFETIKTLIDDKEQDKRQIKLLGLVIAMLFLAIPFYIFKIWRLAGATITSPLNSMMAGWHKGRELGGPIGLFVGGLLLTLSLMCTITFYTVLFPLAFKAFILKGSATLVGHAPGASAKASHVTSKLPPFLKWLGNSVFRPVGHIFMKALGPVVHPVIKSLKLGLHDSWLAMSAGAVTIVSIGGGCFKPLVRRISSVWSRMRAVGKSTKQKVRPSVYENDSPKVVSDETNRMIQSVSSRLDRAFDAVGRSGHTVFLALKSLFVTEPTPVELPKVDDTVVPKEDDTVAPYK